MAGNDGLRAPVFVLVRALRSPGQAISATWQETELRERRNSWRSRRSGAPFLR